MAVPRKSRSFPFSLSAAASGSSLDDDKWYKNIACCGLQSTSYSSSLRQCTIIDLGEKAPGFGIAHKPALAIVTNHSVIPSLSRVKEWKLLAGPSAVFKLVEGKFLHCVSCCGPRRENADWTLLILKREFVTELVSHKSCKELKFPPVKAYSYDMLEKVQFHVYQRNTTAITQELVANLFIEPRTSTDTQAVDKLENTVSMYRESCTLKLCSPHRTKRLTPEFIGAAVFSCIDAEKPSDDLLDRVSLLALYHPTNPKTPETSHPPVSSSDGKPTEVHCAVAIHHIVNMGLMVMALGDRTYCELIPCLALLRDVSPHHMAESIRKLNLCIGQCKRSLSLPKLVELLEFILKPEELPPVVSLTRKPSITKNAPQKRAHLELLTTIYSQFNNSEPGDLIKAIRIPQEGNPPPSIYSLVEKTCNQLLKLMNHCAKGEERATSQVVLVIQAGFGLWQEMLHFNHKYPNGATASLLSSECFEVARKLKSREDCRDNVVIQRNFGKISEWHLARLKEEHSMVSSKLEQKVSSLSATTSEQRQQIAKLEQHCKHQTAALQQEISDLKAQKELDGEQAIKVQQKVSDMQREKALFEKERAKQMQRIQELEEETKELHKSRDEAVSNLKSMLDERRVQEKLIEQRIQPEKERFVSSQKQQARKAQEAMEQRHRLDMQQQEQKIKELEHQLQASNEANIQLQVSQEKAGKNMKAQVEAERRVLQQRYKADIDQHSQRIKEEFSNTLATLKKENDLAVEQLRSEIKQRQEQLEMQTKELEKVKEENSKLLAEKERQNEKLHSLNEEVQELKKHHEINVAVIHQLKSGPTSPRTQRALSVPTPQASPYSSRRERDSLLPPTVGLEEFPNMDIVRLLEKDVLLRDEIAKCFIKVQGAQDGTWEDLLYLLDERYGVVMDAKSLDGLLIGDILLGIVRTWGKKTKVTVDIFCQICKDLRNTRVVEILEEAKNTFDKRGVHPIV